MKSYIYKHKMLICVVSILVIGVWWWITPYKCLRGHQSGDILYVEVAYGTNGEIKRIDDKEQIKYIVDTIKEIELKKEKLSFRYAGTDIWLAFFDMEAKKVEEFYINGGTTIRKDPFFYNDNSGKLELCYSYLKVIGQTLN